MYLHYLCLTAAAHVEVSEWITSNENDDQAGKIVSTKSYVLTKLHVYTNTACPPIPHVCVALCHSLKVEFSEAVLFFF